MNFRIETSNVTWPDVEQAITAAKRDAKREGRMISVFQGKQKLADCWPDGKVDMTSTGSTQISIPLKGK